MDLSNEYATMCAEATEIQQIFANDGQSEGKDQRISAGYFIAGNTPEDLDIQSAGNYLFADHTQLQSGGCGCCQVEIEIHVWLPTMDQLAEMIKQWNRKYSSAFFQHIATNSKFRGISETGYDSLEKHLLAFVMFENYSKQWDTVTRKWVMGWNN